MASNLEKILIHKFAVKYHNLYVLPQTDISDVYVGFEKQCKQLALIR